MRRMALAVRLLGAASVVGTGLCLQAFTPATGPNLTVTPSSQTAGGTVTFSGNVPLTTCAAGKAIALTSSATLFPPSGTGPAVSRPGLSGDFSVTFQIPSSVPSGSYTVGVDCGVATVGLTTSLTVTGVTPSTATIAVAPTTAHPGDTVTVSGVVPVSTCPAADPVQLTGDSELFPNGGLGPQGDRNATGAFSIPDTVPTSAALGRYSIGARCAGAAVSVAAALTVTSGLKLTVSPASAPAGGSVTIAGVVPVSGSSACPAGDAVQFTGVSSLFPPDGVGPQVPRDSAGNFTFPYSVPTVAPPGTYRFGLRCGGAIVGVSATMQVTAATTTTSSSTSTTLTINTTPPTTGVLTFPSITTPTTSHTSSSSSQPSVTTEWIAFAAVLAVTIGGLVVFRR